MYTLYGATDSDGTVLAALAPPAASALFVASALFAASAPFVASLRRARLRNPPILPQFAGIADRAGTRR